jgi:hypothetical protein
MRRIKRLLSVVSAGIISVSSLFVLAPIVHAAPATCTWTGAGGDTLVSNGANWGGASGCHGTGIPASGDTLDFPNLVVNRTVNNDLGANPTFSLSFSGAQNAQCGVDSYTISGNQFTISGPLVMNHTAVSCTPGGFGGGLGGNYITAPVTIAGIVTVDGSSSVTDEALNLLNSTVSGTGSSIIARKVTLGLKTIAASVAIGIEQAGTLWYETSACDAVISSGVQIAGRANITVDSTVNPGACYYTSSVSLAGGLTLTSNAEFNADYSVVTATSLTSNSYTLKVADGSSTKLTIGSQLYEGTYVDTTYSANDPLTHVSANQKNRAIVTGTYAGADVGPGGYLKGTGTIVGDVHIMGEGFFAPGMSPGCLATGNFNLAGTYQAEIQGGTACSGYDQANVTGTVTITGATLSLATTGFVPTNGQKFTIINNDAADAVVGTFAGLAEGATIVDGGVTYTISYIGGDGNDVVLTVTGVNAAAIPGAPNTGFRLLTNNPLATLIGGLLAAAGLGLLARRQFSK